MTCPNSTLIAPENTPYYHCISRCVRHAFLFGKDPVSGQSFDHRKFLLVERCKFLTEVFAIDIAAYAVMSKHYHLILHADKGRSESWTKEEVITRWTRLYRGTALVQLYLKGKILSEPELEIVETTVALWRSRLCSISWFMSCLNFYIALQANKEDGCIWQGRFKSQALLDETPLLSSMAYVDLNPTWTGMADDLEKSDSTSIQLRIGQLSVAYLAVAQNIAQWKKPAGVAYTNAENMTAGCSD